MAVLGSLVKGCAAFEVDSEVIGTLFQQKVYGVDVAVFGSSKQGRSPLKVSEVHVGLAAEKQSNGASVAVTCSGEERGAAFVVLYIDRCAGVEKQLVGV